jgi:peptidoglycan/LPS O-acetylase OafA/YrhL
MATPSRAPARFGTVDQVNPHTEPQRVRTPARAASGFRPDIQGIRAIAVGAVVLNHLMAWPTGGFVGVDVFFVVSGFLITGLLLRERERTGRISMRQFFTRRIRRIMPAAAVTIVITTALGFLILSPSRANATLGDAFFASIFLANWRFAAGGTDYFATDLGTSPLQHFWTLSVEEQFYLVWPWMLIAVLAIAAAAASRAGKTITTTHQRTILGAVLGVIVAASLTWSIVETATAPSVAYFATASRVWELGAGALLAVGAGLFTRLGDRTRLALATVGLVGIIASMVLLTDKSPVPGPLALAPVLATVALLAAGIGGGHALQRPLAHPVMTRVGDMSYSIYLWHFPVIVFAAVLAPDGGPVVAALTLAAIAGLSLASYVFVEAPFRHPRAKKTKDADADAPSTPSSRPTDRPSAGESRHARRHSAESSSSRGILLVSDGRSARDRSARDRAPRAQSPTGWSRRTVALAASFALLIPVAAVAAPRIADAAAAVPQPVSAAADLTAGLEAAADASVWPETVPAVDDLKRVPEMKRTEGCLNPEDPADPTTCVEGDGEKLAIVVGDSFAAVWSRPLREILAADGYRTKVISYSACPFAMVEVDLDLGTEASDRCNESREGWIAAIDELAPELVLVVDSEYPVSQNTGLGDDRVQGWADARVEALEQIEQPGREIVIIQPNPGGVPVESCYSPLGGPAGCIMEVRDIYDVKTSGDRLAAAELGLTYVETEDWFVVDGEVMPYAGDVIQRTDGGHLTAEYAALIEEPLRDRLELLGVVG